MRGQHADFDPDVADLVERPAIGTALLVEHLLAEDSFAQDFVVGLELLAAAVFVFFGNRCHQFLLDLLDQGVAFGLGMLLGVQCIREIARRYLSSRSL